MKKVIVGFVVLALIIVGFVAFNNSSTTSKVSNDDIKLTGETKEFTIEAFQFGFDPNIIEVNQGDIVKITAYSKDVPHGIAIPKFGVNLYLGDSTPQTAEFIADKKGEFGFYCSVSCGSGHGSMTGKIVVN